MISLVMFTVAIAGVLSVGVTVTSGFREGQLAVAMEAAARNSMDFITNATRSVSPAVASGNLQHVNTCARGALSVTNSSTGSDELTIVFASGAVTSTRGSYGAGSVAITVADASQLSVGDSLMITDLLQGHLVTVTSVDAASGTVGLAAQTCATLTWPSAGYPAGSLVIGVQRVRFYIGSVDGIPALMMDPDAEGPAAAEPLAEGIEDMQIAVGADTDGNGALTEVGAAAGDDEWAYNVAGDPELTSAIRAVRITLVARTKVALTGDPTYALPAAEDRPASNTFDNYRRRVLRSTIEVRNLGGSP
jgi:hypothetical protein